MKNRQVKNVGIFRRLPAPAPSAESGRLTQFWPTQKSNLNIEVQTAATLISTDQLISTDLANQ